MFDEEVAPGVADAIRRATEALADTFPGGIDDLLLLELLLRDGDDTVLRALGTRTRQLLREIDAERAAEAAADAAADGVPSIRYPLADDVVRYAFDEASDLGGYAADLAAVHVLLALFAFRGARSEAVMRRCGIEWRPLRSVVRRLGLTW